MDTLGRHIIAELDGCSVPLLGDSAAVLRLLREAVRQARSTAIAEEIFDFKGGGVSGFILLAESHLSIHTWPEYGYAAIDIYTCGRHTLPMRACDHLAGQLGATQLWMITLDRGITAPSGGHAQQLTSMELGVVRPLLAHLHPSV